MPFESIDLNLIKLFFKYANFVQCKEHLELGFRIRISSQDFESGSRVRIWSQDLESGSRVRILSQDLESEFRVRISIDYISKPGNEHKISKGKRDER